MIKKTEMLTIVFVDIGNYTRTTSSLSRELFDELHDVFDTLTTNTVSEFDGHIIKKIGDAFLITFTISTDAVKFGIALQKAFAKYNSSHPDKPKIHIRVAIHVGEALVRGNDVYGDAVNTAARIEGIAKVDDVVFSDAVYSAMNKSEIDYKFIGKVRLKGLKVPVGLFKVRTRKDIESENLRIFRKKVKRIKIAVLRLVLLFFGISVLAALLYATIEGIF